MIEHDLSARYEALDVEVQRRFRALGAMAQDGTADKLLIQAIWGDDDPIDTANGIDVLLRAGLLAVGDDGRYRLLNTYARALAEKQGELEESFACYADQITEAAGQFSKLLDKPEAWVTFQSTLAPHLLEVGDGLERRYNQPNPDIALTDRALTFAYNVIVYLRRWPEIHRIGWLEMGLTSAIVKGDQEQEALFLNALATRYKALGEVRRALNYYERALPLYRTIRDRRGEAITLLSIGLAWSDLGEKRKALDTCEQAISLCRAIGDRSVEADALNEISLIWVHLGEKHKALATYEKALSLYRAIGDRDGEATALNNMAGLYFVEGYLTHAVETIRQVIIVVGEMGMAAEESLYRANLASALHQMGNRSEAISELEAAIRLLRSQNLSHDVSGTSVTEREARLAQWQSEAPKQQKRGGLFQRLFRGDRG